ncbi:MAG TPA: hypothetical protein VNM90_14645 [Haliangium sp.]|nr:hypothetical protein [Haliangium sp.]
MHRSQLSSRRFSPRALALAGVVCALALAGAPALAQPSLIPEAPAPAPASYVRTDHYGLWVAGVDAAGFAAALATNEPGYLATSYLFGAPAVHLFHGNYKSFLGSISLRTGLVLGGMFIGSRFGDCGQPEPDWCELERTFLGGLIGAGSALVIDWFWLAEKETRVYTAPPALVRAGSLRANPDLQVSHTGDMMLGLRGSF